MLCGLIGSMGYAQESEIAMTVSGAKYNENSLSNSAQQTKHDEKMVKDHQVVVIKTNNPYMGYVYVDYLYWAAKKTGVFLDMNHYVDNNLDISGHPLELKSKWTSGVRGEVGFSNIFDWMIDGSFTYYSNHRHVHYRPQWATATSLVRFNNDDAINSSDTYSKITYWTADIDIATIFNFSSSVSFKPIISVRTGSFKTKLNYFAVLSDIDTGELDQIIEAHYPIKFLGVGPKAGLNAYFKFGKTGLNILGGLNASLLYGKTHFSDYLKIQNTSTLLSDVTGHYKDLKATLGLLMGAEYRYFFDDDKMAVMVRANWETNYWWDLTDHYQPTEFICSKSLILYGVNVGIGFEF
jgi:hypothetical protein